LSNNGFNATTIIDAKHACGSFSNNGAINSKTNPKIIQETIETSFKIIKRKYREIFYKLLLTKKFEV
jgi:hypothetical protein